MPAPLFRTISEQKGMWELYSLIKNAQPPGSFKFYLHSTLGPDTCTRNWLIGLGSSPGTTSSSFIFWHHIAMCW